MAQEEARQFSAHIVYVYIHTYIHTCCIQCTYSVYNMSKHVVDKILYHDTLFTNPSVQAALNNAHSGTI